MYSGYALAFYDTVVSSDAALVLNYVLTNSPEATVAKCSPYASFFAQKMLKNTKNAFFLHFFSKKFAYVHFLLYLCTRFRKGSTTYGHGAIV